MKEHVVNFLEKHGLFDPKKILMVGFSGGGDSLCLLDVLYKLGLNPVAAHLNHNWRSQESKQEQEKARQYCKQRGIEFYTEILSSDLPQTEEEARNQRYRFFNEVARKTNADAILTGHTSTDQVETVLYRIIKGTGISGLKGIPEKRENIYRPLLNISREECIEYCKENGLEPSMDSSNYNLKYLRNRLRLSLLPELRTYNSEVDLALLRLSEIAADADEIIDEYVGKLNVGCVLRTDISLAVKKRLLVGFLAQNNIEYSYERINELLSFIEKNKTSKSGKTFSIAKGLWVFVSHKEIKLIDKAPAELPELKITEWEGEAPAKFPQETSHEIYADLNNVRRPVYLRTRKPGDIIQPFGMKEKTKLKKYLINRGIPEYTRNNLSLLVNEEEVLWVVGVGISELLRVKEIPTHKIRVE